MGNIIETSHFEKLAQDNMQDFGDENTVMSEVLEIDHRNVEKILHNYSLVELEIEELEARKQASMEFYNDEIERKKSHLKYKDNALKIFLNSTGKKTIKFPNGTIATRKTTKHEYTGEEKVLIKWCDEQKVEGTYDLVKETRKPSKSAITKFIKETGFAPDDWEINESESFNVKTNRKRR